MMDSVNQVPNYINQDSNSEQKRSDLMTDKTQELLLRIREVCKAEDITANDILELFEAHPEVQPVSKSSIEAALRECPRTAGLKPSTIRSIAAVVLNLTNDTTEDVARTDEYDPDKGDVYFAEREALRQLVLLKSAEEERLRASIEKSEAAFEKKYADQSILHDSNIKRLLDLHNEHKSGQEKTITILVEENSFLRTELTAERESRKRLYDDLKTYIQKYEGLSEIVRKLQKHHEDDD